MSGKIVFDTCAILDFVNKKAGALDLDALFSGESRFISIITKLELLKFPDITPEEEKRILVFLPGNRSALSPPGTSPLLRIFRNVLQYFAALLERHHL
jgi:hypothetical protein